MATKRKTKPLNISLPKVEALPNLVGKVTSANFDGTKTIAVGLKKLVVFPSSVVGRVAVGDQVTVEQYANGDVKRVKTIRHIR